MRRRVLRLAPAGALAAVVVGALAHPAGGTVLAAAQEGTGPDASVRKVAALAGYLAYGLMWSTLVWGLALTTGIVQRFVRRQTVYGGHMVLAVTTLAFTLFHAATYIFQTAESFSPLAVFNPLMGEPEVGIGVVGFELMAAITFSLWLQRRLGYRRWHIVHWLAYPAFIASIAHMFATSTEARSGGLITIALLASSAVLVVFTALRALPATRAQRPARIPAMAP